MSLSVHKIVLCIGLTIVLQTFITDIIELVLLELGQNMAAIY
uniref:Uncharacterized protein n=1 Tax=virus sp. ctBM815 TaxID=2825806 RepID=A0A8S5RK44_9VIRU|nr:MAG TPA: hypothetical protein [virus sp. ctBM815]